VLVDHTVRLGYFEVQFNYFTIRWDRGDGSAPAARAGYSNGAGSTDELPGSGTVDVLTDGGTQPLQVLRRYTLIIYPSGSGDSPAFGEALRLAASGPPPHRESPPLNAARPSVGVTNSVPVDNYFASASPEHLRHAAPRVAPTCRDDAFLPELAPVLSDDGPWT
jgi:hypothetical protein